ncbi:MAG: deoxyribose-phosphate aldolase [Candidatus Terraquivivens tikiterensis]|uniref:Deoxyribose-phosphate aldolase n=1 Tax=Candidatus Terraquivivens tikiterensis TaxID=1980982 RepID=A0A2R7Y110_9ARCH|nr:MAG: deoxyribose-phosphate aldolase [Candidatus Terraquivivens tikiterensis]
MIGRRELARLIDHTDLRPTATDADVRRLCEDAVRHGFYAVCINPFFVRLASKLLLNSGVKVCTVIGFPLGMNTLDVKAFEARRAVEDGADELDLVINLGMVKSGNYAYVEEEVSKVLDLARGAVVKVIIETGYLTVEEMGRLCEIAVNVGADFVKTCTGFGPRGVSVEDVRLIKGFTGGRVGIKAAGGIRTYEQAVSLIEAGATRLGTSHGLKILEGAPSD